MAHGFDHGAVIKATIEKILQISLPLVLCTDSKSLYDCLVQTGNDTGEEANGRPDVFAPVI